MKRILISAAILFPLFHPEMLQRVSVLIPVTAPHGYRPPTPQNVEVSAEERARLVEKGFFNQS